jgi:hypothetical protein
MKPTNKAPKAKSGKPEAPAIVSAGGGYRFATPSDIAVSRGTKLKNSKSWKARIASALSGHVGANRRMSGLSSLASLTASRARAALVLAGSPNRERVMAFHDNAIEKLQSGKDAERVQELYAGVRSGDPESQQILAGTVTRMTSMLLVGNANWLQFYERVGLGDEDQFVAESRVGGETAVRFVGQDGVPWTQSPNDNFSFTPTPLLNISTAVFEYPLFDIQMGDGVREHALSTVDLAQDLAAKVDELAASQIEITSPNTILTNSFTTTGPPELRSYVANSRVDVGNLPAGNIIVLSDNTATSLPRVAVILAAIDYASSWGFDAIAGQPDLVPQAIHVPSKLASAFLSEISPTAPSGVHNDNMVRNGPFQISYGGANVTIVPDNTLSPDSPYAYVRFNRPVGFFIDKPSQSRTIVDESPNQQRLNKGTVSQSRAIGFSNPVHWGANILAVKFAD